MHEPKALLLMPNVILFTIQGIDISIVQNVMEAYEKH